MAIRHKTPTIFSIYMVDVLCCALGCVILLWQVNYQEAEKQTAAAVARGDDLQLTVDRLKNAHLAIQSLTRDNERLKDEKGQLTIDLQNAKDLALVEKKKYDALNNAFLVSEDSLAKALKESKLTAEELKALAEQFKIKSSDFEDKVKLNAALLKKIDDLDKLKKALEVEVTEKTLALIAANKKSDDEKVRAVDIERLASALGKEKIDLLAKLKSADLRVSILESDVAENKKTITDLLKDKTAMDLKMTISAKDLDTLRAAMDKASAENIAALKRSKAIQAAADQRFAGITLTGKKVIFMVDMSGSMELTDSKTADPDKWPTLCETIARILSSLFDVTHFQVIMFNDTIRYPLGGAGKWIEVSTREENAQTIAKTLKAIRPAGPTNMYAAFDEAFKYRSQGLDTIYVFSDGLPNDGPGRPANPKATEDEITVEQAKYLRAKLKNDWNANRPFLPKVRINTIGFFYESPDVGAFLWALSREHDGSFVGLR